MYQHERWASALHFVVQARPVDLRKTRFVGHEICRFELQISS
jgi:hypothetical protein